MTQHLNRLYNPPFNPRIDGMWPPEAPRPQPGPQRQLADLGDATLWVDINTAQIRRDRCHALARRALWTLAIAAALALAALIFNAAITRAVASAEIAPVMMRH